MKKEKVDEEVGGGLTPEEKAARVRASARAWYAKNKEKSREYSKRWRAKNPEKVKAMDARYRDNLKRKKIEASETVLG